jgi:hypothetical protein
MHPIADKAEVAIDFPDKFYMGGFGRDCAFEGSADSEGVLIRLVRPGEEKRVAEIHLHHFLFANILDELARSLGEREPIDELHREPLLNAARRLVVALERAPAPSPAG